MQIDFCGQGGYMDRMGFDLDFLRRPIAPIASLLHGFRHRRYPVIYTRETFKPDLSDVQPHRLWRPQGGIAVGDQGPLGRTLIEGEPCWQIIPEVAPHAGEKVFDKPSYGAFAPGALGPYLQAQGLRHLVIAGLTTDCCISNTLREALDRGFQCLTVEDACAASSRETHAAALTVLRKKSGIFGVMATASTVLAALDGDAMFEKGKMTGCA